MTAKDAPVLVLLPALLESLLVLAPAGLPDPAAVGLPDPVPVPEPEPPALEPPEPEPPEPEPPEPDPEPAAEVGVVIGMMVLEAV